MEMIFTLPGGSRVDARIGPFTVHTDQPPDATAPAPFELFLASIGACAGFYVLAFCRKRGIATDGIRVVQQNDMATTGMVERVRLTVELPPGFPDRYRDAVLRAVDQCTVKKHLEHPPAIDVQAVQVAPA